MMTNHSTRSQLNIIDKQRLPEASVVMSVFNGEAYLEESLRSILEQSYANFEFVIVDDGSTDKTWDILQDYKKIDSRIKLFRLRENLGTSKALNVALKLAQGKFIVRQDADDISLRDRLLIQISFLENNTNIGLVGSRVMMINPEGDEIKIAFTIEENDEIKKTLLDYMCLCGPTFVIRRSHFEKAGYYFMDDMSYSEDYDLCLRMAEVSQIYNLNEVLYLYRQHSASVSQSQRYKQLKNKSIALERAITRRSGSKKPEPELRYKMARDYFRTSVLGFYNGETEEAQKYLNHSILLYPKIIEDKNLIEKVIEHYKPTDSNDSTLKFIEGVFSNLLPDTSIMRQVKRKLMSRVHMKFVFDGLHTNDYRNIRNHIWNGIKNDPLWLLNRGVLKILISQYLDKGSSYHLV